MSNSLYWNGDIVWISSKDMKSSRISGSELKITNLALNEMTLYHPGTLLLVARSGILKHSLPLAILEVDATINQDIKALQVHGCNAFYLYYAILSQEDNIIRNPFGGKKPRGNQNLLIKSQTAFDSGISVHLENSHFETLKPKFGQIKPKLGPLKPNLKAIQMPKPKRPLES